MTIIYTVNGEERISSSCYGALNHYLRKDGEDRVFDGIYLHLTKEKVVRVPEYGNGLFLDEVKDDDDIRAIMKIARATGFGKYIPRTINKLKKDGGISFGVDVPYYVVVAVTGFFRMWANHTDFLKVYDMLRSKGLDPYEALVFTNTLSISSNTYNGMDGKPIVCLMGEHSIIPWNMANRESIAKFRTWNERADELPPMGVEYKDSGELDYNGRDQWFGAPISGNGDGSEIYELANYDDEGCETVNHIVGEVDVYSENEVNLTSLVRTIKSWRSKK